MIRNLIRFQKYNFEKARMDILKNMYLKLEKETTESKKTEILQNIWTMERTMAAKQEADAVDKQFKLAARRDEHDQSWRAWWFKPWGIAGPLIQAVIAGGVAYLIYDMQSEDKKQIQMNILDREFFKWLRDLYSGEQHAKYSEGIGKIHQYEQSFKNKQIAHDTFQSVQTKTPGPTAVPITKTIMEDVHNVNRSRILANDYKKSIVLANNVVKEEHILSKTVLNTVGDNLNARITNNYPVINPYNKILTENDLKDDEAKDMSEPSTK